MMWLLSFVTFGLILSFLVWIHELGHYLAARWGKIKVEEFGMGYPPLAKVLFKRAGTLFTLNWVPFGGFVKMEGEDEVDNSSSPSSFQNKSLFTRMVVILAGAGMNFLFGIVAFSIVFSIMGIPQQLTRPRIGLVQPNSPAATAGIPSSVEVLAVRIGEQTVPTPTVDALITQILSHRGQTLTVVTTGPCNESTCQESAQEFSVYVRTESETPVGQGAMGIEFVPVLYRHYPAYQMPFRGIAFGVEQALVLGGQIVVGVWQIFGDLFTKAKVPSDLSGPVGIVHQAQQSKVFEQGWLSVLGFAGMLSINLGVMNVLPIPPLDGGRAVFLVLEKVLGKDKVSRVEGYAHYSGYIGLLALIVLVTARDIVRIFIR